MNNCENCIEGRPRIGRLAGVTRTMRLAIFEGEGVPTGTPQDLTAQTVVVRVLLDGTNDIYVPDFVVEGTGNNVIKFVWPANRQAVGNYTLDVTMTDGGNNVNRVNWHGKDGIRLVQYSNQVYGEDATGQESSEAVGLVGYFTTNGVGMSAFDEWRGSEYSEGYPQTVAGFMAYLRQPATDAANAARQQMQQIQSRADEDHTRAGNDHSTAESDHTRAEGDHTTAASDHTTAAADHTAAAADHTQAGNDHTRAEGDHTTAASDHTQAAADHTRAASDHSAAASDHTRAGQDHTRSGSDHEIAVADHAQAEADHTRAESDHGTAAADHTQAGADHSTAAADHTHAASDHSTAAEDHTQALADHAVMEGYDTRLTNVEEDVSQLGQEVDSNKSRTGNIKLSAEKKFSITDNEGNIAAQVDSNGVLDVIDIGDNIKEKINDVIDANDTVGAIQEDVDSLEKTTEFISSLLASPTGTSLQVVDSRGFYIIDSKGHIGWSIEPYVVKENGVFLIDKNGNVGVSINDGEFDFAKIGEPTIQAIKTGIADNVVGKNSGILDMVIKPNKNIDGLLALDNGADTIKTVTVQNSSAKKKLIVHLFLHTCASHYSSGNEDVFFNGNCKNDFSDVRFYYDGLPCKAQFGKLFNGEIVSDSNISAITGFLSDGRGFGTDSTGLFIASDNLTNRTHIPGTGDGFTEHASSEYFRTNLFPLQVVDANDNIFAYAGGKLYRVNAETDYTTWDEICDFSEQYDGSTIYPDIQPHGLDVDSHGRIYFGGYQTQFIGKLWVSDVNGENFTVKYNKDKGCEQHIHHIHYSPTEDRVYASFDCNQVVAGPITIYTEDGGDTWIHLEEEFLEYRGRDYWPMYFGDGFKLGGGESYINGDGTVLRSECINGQDVNMICAVPGKGGGICCGFDDKNIIVGVRGNRYAHSNSILYSTDYGKTFDRIWTNYRVITTSGSGFRQNTQHPVLVAGDVKECLIIGLHEEVNKRIYLGGLDYCREVFIEVDNAPVGNIEIVVKNKHLFEYPFDNIFGETFESSWNLPLNEGFGGTVSDGYMNYAILGKYNWYNGLSPIVRFGDLASKNYLGKHDSSSALKLGGGAYINTGKHPELNTNKNFSISFLLNGDRNVFKTCLPEDIYTSGFTSYSPYLTFLRWGNTRILLARGGIVVSCPNGTTTYYSTTVNYESSFTRFIIAFGNNSSDWYISADSYSYTQMTTNNNLVLDNLGMNDLIICNDKSDDFGIYISDLRIYDKKLTQDEMKEIYFGSNI